MMVAGESTADGPGLVLVLSPGGAADEGGIQRFTAALLALVPEGVLIRLVEARRSGRLWQARLVLDVLRAARGLRRERQDRRVAVLCLHGAFLPLAKAAAVLLGRSGVVTFYYGQEIWSAGWLRRMGWRWLQHVPVTISGYSAGALAAILRRPPTIMLPTMPSIWADRFGTDEPRRAAPGPVRVLSVFRLSAARSKRAGTIIEAVAQLRREGIDVELCLAGRGPLDGDLAELAGVHPWIELVESPGDEALVGLYRTADVFVLATGVSHDRAQPSGEGFGIVLVEAALAGLPVVGPAGGGSRDAMVDGFTGEVVADERVETLADALRRLSVDRPYRERLGRRGRLWATEMTSTARVERSRQLLWSLLVEATDGAGRSGP